MNRSHLLIFIVLICFVIYFVGSSTSNSSQLNHQPSKYSNKKDSISRIISISKHPIPFIVLGLDANEKRLIGINPDSKIGMKSNILNQYFPGFQSISDKVSTKAFVPNIEEIIRLKPDLILNWKRFSEANAQMQSFGFKVIGINYDGTDENDREMINTVATAIGKEKKANSIMQKREIIKQKMKLISDNIPQQKRPKVIFFYNYETLRVGGEKCYENYCINLAGGRNMAAGLGVDKSVNIEQILEWNPDIILFGGWLQSLKPETIYQNPILAEVSAVRNHRVFKMPHWASNETELIWEWLAEIIQPKLFQFNIRENICELYTSQYKINLTDADIDELLFSNLNNGSAFYKNLNSHK
ncbi:MAG: ABC transporter substrate-binding protein [Bacteroidota bacterium]